MCAEKLTQEINDSLLKHIAMLKPTFPRRTVISIGDYSSQILLKSSIIGKNEDILTFFIQKTKEDTSKLAQLSNETNDIISIDEKADTHYWFNVQQYIAEHDAIVEKLKSKPT